LKDPARLLPILLLLAIPSMAQSQAQKAGKKADLPEGPPPAASPWRTWKLDASEERVHSTLLALLREDGLTPVEGDRSNVTLATNLIEFDNKRFGVSVSIPPPKATPQYPYFQLNVMTSGRYGLECRIAPGGPNQTRVDLRALLETRGFDKNLNVQRWVPRSSNGEVESNYFTRLALRLLSKPAPAASSTQ